MYAFKPHVFTEHFSSSIAKPKGRINSKIHCDGKNVYIYNNMYPAPLSAQDLLNNLFGSNLEAHEIWLYNLAGQQWRLMRNNSNLPDKDHVTFGIIFESSYLVFWTKGGRSNDGLSSLRYQLHIWDLNTESVLVRETSGDIPDVPTGLNLIRHGKYFYTVGIDALLEEFSDVYRLNIEDGVWEAVYICKGLDANEPVGRSDHTLVHDKNMIYIFGGVRTDSELEFSLFEIPGFDLEKCCWKIVETHGDEDYVPHYPVLRYDFAVTSYTDPDTGEINVIISGGIDCDHENALNDVWRLNLTSLKWTCLEKYGTVLPDYVYSHSMTVSPAGKLFTFGGHISINMEDETCSSSLHSTWLRIPKLTDICLEAVFHYFPNLKSMTDKEIMSLGLPLQLLKSRIH
ncbi:kelch domain-containing protein 10 homolog [Microplitis mediator]|uniref:kelch domain-containing protein 10 homolog n=1 Tax=Microplitis mediator TaxID=375433 RepID=UPI002555D3AE|nr:kelch domain-containing protein 10 homolog [Microplitis mediator]